MLFLKWIHFGTSPNARGSLRKKKYINDVSRSIFYKMYDEKNKYRQVPSINNNVVWLIVCINIVSVNYN